ncbi:acetyltransferase [Zalerion maritima]|uniref:Acetyltransferase n=1 Tax=Zalerion maritima TaxID=339359 RepID=A0AAD5WQP6_9PEZI|nr:acetyltransferase [Zalerion maritima]
MEPFIRPYQAEDFDATAHICRATLPPSLSRSKDASFLAPYLWTHQYTHLSPGTCFVLDSGSGVAVGYCIGCPSVPDLVSAYPSYISGVLKPDVPPPEQAEKAEPWCLPGTQDVNPRALIQQAYDVQKLLVNGRKEVIAKWKGTMHIDLLDAYQGKGWGKKLIEKFVEAVKGSGQNEGGVHIGIAGENGKVVKFYEKVGFKNIAGGEKSGTIWMVRDI